MKRGGKYDINLHSFYKYGFVFGIANLAAFLASPLFGKFGTKIGPKLLYNIGALLQPTCGIIFGFLSHVDNTALFLGLSYFLRYCESWPVNNDVKIYTKSDFLVCYPNKCSNHVHGPTLSIRHQSMLLAFKDFWMV